MKGDPVCTCIKDAWNEIIIPDPKCLAWRIHKDLDRDWDREGIEPPRKD